MRNLPTSPLPALAYPSGAPNTDSTPDGHGHQYPYEFQWSIWTLVLAKDANADCPPNNVPTPYPDTLGLFTPLDPGNPAALGVYPLCFYLRQQFDTVVNTSNTPCYDGSC